jgi:hypothetical protein
VSKKPVDFVSAMQTFESVEGVQRHPRPTLVKSEPAAAESKTPESVQLTVNGRPVQKSRLGKVSIGLWVDPAVRKQMQRLAIDLDKDQGELIAEGLNLMFERYGQPPIANAP